MALFLFFSMRSTAQLKPIAPVTITPKDALPYWLPQIENGIKTITAVEISAKQPGAINVNPNFSISSSSQQCALLNSIHPSLVLQGERKDASLVDLKWKAKDLYDKKGFEIQRSFGDTNNFKSITFVNAYSKALAKEEYKLTDINKSIQPAYYRLKQIKPVTGYAYSILFW